MKQSAGLVLYRFRDDAVEVLLGHMGGPLWARKDAGGWTIPKGEVEPGEDEHAAALREFAEELGVPAPAAEAPDLDLGTVRQRAGKLVAAWAREADLDVTAISSNTFALEWPPRSGRMQEFPELDRAGWFPLARARGLVVAGQVPLLDRLEELLAREPAQSATTEG
ncbi:NUDIX domain-containing protein [Cellulosimicrobium cellulans]|uniref:NUDIX domain-containing protein n=1 Tax=Cellulosimicrobium cellulans TaxID=1710 RepID=UPI000886FD0A|nr:NUDIX domain-containing protein [Sphaerisporangium cinnabarinum]MCR1983661.1 NUDIX domain-containing protein [Cellulosimicrobium cellulans]PTU54456.1 NUDIX domain-containing protein [Sphaerisporangium cinnabarinum]SDF07683.1 Predicted NTP pyrophosphohydrolase, NUDIX family [Cellulosimicrobium cellulans]